MSAFVQVKLKEGQHRLIRLDQITQIAESKVGTALVYIADSPTFPLATDCDYNQLVDTLRAGLSQPGRLEQKLDKIIEQINQPIRLNHSLLDEHVERIGNVRSSIDEFPDEPGGPFDTKRMFKSVDALSDYTAKLLHDGHPKEQIEAYYRHMVRQFHPRQHVAPMNTRAG